MSKGLRNFIRNQRAFTLIELLVVIAIISLLSSVVLASLSSARARARDTRRVMDMQQLITAIELYRNQQGYLPGRGGSCTPSPDWTLLSDSSNCMVQELETVMTAIPQDPSYDGTTFYYAYDSSHYNTGSQCDGERAAFVSFHTSETGIKDRETTGGYEGGIGDDQGDGDDWNRAICWD